MAVIIGMIVVMGSVIGGYLIGHGNLAVLFQPGEFLTIGGAALGSLIISTSLHTIKEIIGALKNRLTGKGHGQKFIMDVIWVLNQLSSQARREGLLVFEQHAEDPEKSFILQKIIKQHELVGFICDALRLISIGLSTEELTEILNADIETREAENAEPAEAVTTVADALPGLGIVAAVLGIIVTMNSIGGDTATVGKHVASALVGTFLGVLLAYGFVGPIAHVVKQEKAWEIILLKVVRNGMISVSSGLNPFVVCESARRSIPESLRPSFKEMETSLNAK